MIPNITPEQAFHLLIHFVFYCSIASLFLAAIERSVHKFFPGTRFDQGISFLNDLVTQFGALNLRDKIAGTPPIDRRQNGQ